MKHPYSLLALLLRVVLAAIFLFAAYNKLANPLSFKESIEAFHLPLPRWFVVWSTFAVPWTEIFCGVAMLMGLWSRAAATVFILLLGVFIFAVISAIERHLNPNCGCFGKFKLYCDGIGWCKVRENCVLAAAAGVILIGGGGRAALDRLFGDKPGRLATK